MPRVRHQDSALRAPVAILVKVPQWKRKARFLRQLLAGPSPRAIGIRTPSPGTPDCPVPRAGVPGGGHPRSATGSSPAFPPRPASRRGAIARVDGTVRPVPGGARRVHVRRAPPSSPHRRSNGLARIGFDDRARRREHAAQRVAWESRQGGRDARSRRRSARVLTSSHALARNVKGWVSWEKHSVLAARRVCVGRNRFSIRRCCNTAGNR
jgi:hypothetical protein